MADLDLMNLVDVLLDVLEPALAGSPDEAYDALVGGADTDTSKRLAGVLTNVVSVKLGHQASSPVDVRISPQGNGDGTPANPHELLVRTTFEGGDVTYTQKVVLKLERERFKKAAARLRKIVDHKTK